MFVDALKGQIQTSLRTQLQSRLIEPFSAHPHANHKPSNSAAYRASLVRASGVLWSRVGGAG